MCNAQGRQELFCFESICGGLSMSCRFPRLNLINIFCRSRRVTSLCLSMEKALRICQNGPLPKWFVVNPKRKSLSFFSENRNLFRFPCQEA